MAESTKTMVDALIGEFDCLLDELSDPLRGEILEALRSGTEAGSADLALATGASRSSVQRRLRALVDRGLVVKGGRERYRLSR
jgi:DNA-binding transcriptional ArsR family regulator